MAVRTSLSERYGDATQFLALFNPSVQASVIDKAERCYFGSAPCLSAVGKAYGSGTVASWLEIQLRDLANYAGQREKLSESQSQQTAMAIIGGYSFLNMAELLLFFARYKAGRYGRFYGAVDPLAITNALREFCKQRVSEITAIEYARQAAERDKAAEGCVSREEYEAIKKRAEKGDIKAVELLKPPNR